MNRKHYTIRLPRENVLSRAFHNYVVNPLRKCQNKVGKEIGFLLYEFGFGNSTSQEVIEARHSVRLSHLLSPLIPIFIGTNLTRNNGTYDLEIISRNGNFSELSVRKELKRAGYSLTKA